MKDNYDLAKPDPTLAQRIEEKRQRTDDTGFRQGEDRMKSAPELLEENRRLRAELEKAGSHGPETSDGYHTFSELYDHRRALNAALVTALVMAAVPGARVWRSRAHHPDDSPCYDGYFIVGIDLPWNVGRVAYHYPDQYWDDFAAAETLPHAPKWDGAEPPLAVTRLVQFARHW